MNKFYNVLQSEKDSIIVTLSQNVQTNLDFDRTPGVMLYLNKATWKEAEHEQDN